MKSLKYILMTVLLSVALASCEDSKGPEGAGDATIGFAKELYTFKESAGLQRIPVAFTGEPKHYPITFDVAVEVTTGDADDTIDTLMHFTQTTGLKNAGIKDATVYIEFTVKDNQYINDPRQATLTIVNVQGAELATASTVIEIADNDNNPYERLWGNWVLTSATQGSCEVNISGGFTDKDISDNADKLLVCWGWNGYREDVTGYTTPDHQPVWYLKYDAEKQTLTTVPEALLANIFNFNLGEDAEVKMLTGTLQDGKVVTSTTPVTATWSQDMNTITFDSNYLLVGGVYGVSGKYYGYWNAYDKVVLTRKK